MVLSVFGTNADDQWDTPVILLLLLLLLSALLLLQLSWRCTNYMLIYAEAVHMHDAGQRGCEHGQYGGGADGSRQSAAYRQTDFSVRRQSQDRLTRGLSGHRLINIKHVG